MQDISDDICQFKQLQQGFVEQYRSVFPDKLAPKTVVIIPGLSLDQSILAKVKGIIHYEERMLCMLMLLRMPNTHIIYVTSIPIDPVIVDYYLHQLPGITGYHARQRLTLLSCFDASRKSLTDKILERPRLIERIRNSIPAGHFAHLSCFNVTCSERELAVKLKIPVYGCDPDLEYLGTKSRSRKIFRSCNINVADGFEDLYSEEDIITSLTKLKTQNPSALKIVIKINDGFSGEGNGVFSYKGAPENGDLKGWIKDQLPSRLQIVASDVSYINFLDKFSELGGIAEIFIEGHPKYSPSVQCRINPLGGIEIISTHEQLLGEDNGQVFIGANFPANPEYANSIAELAHKISEELKKYGVIGRFSIDFISVKENSGWKHYAIEINLRKGGTTHPYHMLQFLTNGNYEAEKGIYYTANGQPRYYLCSDNLQGESYKGLTPYDLIDIMTLNDLLYNGSTQEGVMFHMIGALSQYGKLGVLCIAASPERAADYYRETVKVLDRETEVSATTSNVEDLINNF
jgi:hypothetical protein